MSSGKRQKHNVRPGKLSDDNVEISGKKREYGKKHMELMNSNLQANFPSTDRPILQTLNAFVFYENNNDRSCSKTIQNSSGVRIKSVKNSAPKLDDRGNMGVGMLSNKSVKICKNIRECEDKQEQFTTSYSRVNVSPTDRPITLIPTHENNNDRSCSKMFQNSSGVQMKSVKNSAPKLGDRDKMEIRILSDKSVKFNNNILEYENKQEQFTSSYSRLNVTSTDRPILLTPTTFVSHENNHDQSCASMPQNSSHVRKEWVKSTTPKFGDRYNMGVEISSVKSVESTGKKKEREKKQQNINTCSRGNVSSTDRPIPLTSNTFVLHEKNNDRNCSNTSQSSSHGRKTSDKNETPKLRDQLIKLMDAGENLQSSARISSLSSTHSMEHLIMRTSTLSVLEEIPNHNNSISSSDSVIGLRRKVNNTRRVLSDSSTESECSAVTDSKSERFSRHSSIIDQADKSFMSGDTCFSQSTTNNSFTSQIEVDSSGSSQNLTDDESVLQIEDDSSDDEPLKSSSREHSPDNLERPSPPRQPRRKRRSKAVPGEWKKNIRFNNRNKGLSYVGHKNKLVPAREVKGICECLRQCSRKFSETQRIVYNKHFWGLGCSNRRRELLSKLVTAVTPARSRKKGKSRRKVTRIYSLKKGRRLVQVCKVFFLNTLDVGEKMIELALKKSERSVTGALSPDRRGRHPPANKIKPHKIAEVHKHINLLPIVPPHLCRRDSKKKYVEGSFTFDEIYSLYRDWAGEQGVKPVEKGIYRREFQNLGIAFHQPKKDQCWCASFHKLPLSDQKKRESEYRKHMQMKLETKLEKEKDVRDAKRLKDTLTLFFDLEAVLYSPYFFSKPIFYLKKMATYNLTVTEAKQNKVVCYVWSENEGRRGSQEIATCLARYIESRVPKGIKYLNLYADNCAGQNKNQTVVSMLGHILMKHATLQSIHLKFLEAGHTYMPCDTAHSAIEREGRNTHINIPRDWISVIRKACDSNPYSTEELFWYNFKDFSALKDQVMPKNLKLNHGELLKWSRVREFKIQKKDPGTIYVKTEFAKPYRKLGLLKKFQEREVSPLYREELGIDSKKWRDLQKIGQKNLIAEEYRLFYAKLKSIADDETTANDGRASIPGRRAR